MSKTTKWILIALGLTLSLCLLPGIVAIFTNGDKITAQPTVQPAVAPVTTVTLAPATSTPAATNPEATSEVSAADTAYLLSVGEISTDLGQAMSGLGEHSTAAGDTPTLLLDNDWKLKAGVYLGIIRGACQRIRDLTPPPRYAATHAELLTAAGYYENACKLYAAGVDELNGAKLKQASQEMNLGTAATQRATTLINQIAAGTPTASAPTTRPSSSSKGPTVKSVANLRAGPGTTYPKTGSAAVGQALNIVARNQAGDWYQLATGAWIAASLVANPPSGIPIATVSPPTSAAAAPVRAAAVPTARGIPAAAASDCDCDHGNTLNCADLDDWDAQACYLRCKEITGQDVHGLDRDSDGNACEWEN
jgi:hypothetical protein